MITRSVVAWLRRLRQGSVHPYDEPGYIARHVVANVAAGAAKSRRSQSDIAVIVPVMAVVGDSEQGRRNERELVRARITC
jgi:alkanesulfonate monooxygenase SsuD/methylene tetrahydromethanopterin reductase-like flavin-dependent oxidoreductase (luciferase family)